MLSDSAQRAEIAHCILLIAICSRNMFSMASDTCVQGAGMGAKADCSVVQARNVLPVCASVNEPRR